jgi:predicted AAA+ superfamily ATPase
MLSRSKNLEEIKNLQRQFPIVAILGARQCGKTTLSRMIPSAHRFDLENPADLARLDQPKLALENLKGLIVIDEIQRKPDLFSLIRYLVDTYPEQKYLILGSASRDLIRQSSETLAGRIAYYYLSGFGLSDIKDDQMSLLWLRGSFPRSFLAESQEGSWLWRENYITTFLERDIPQLGIQVPAHSLRRFWLMISHYHGQVLNYSEIGRSFGVSDMTIKKYIDILTGTFMTRTLQPWFYNTKKRLVKSPKIYLRDSGIFHYLQTITTSEQLFSHPKLGASWEGFALEMLLQQLKLPEERFFFWAVHSGAEVDLFWQDGGKNFAVEFKYHEAPRLTSSMKTACENLSLEKLYVIYPGNESYQLEKNIFVIPLHFPIPNCPNMPLN